MASRDRPVVPSVDLLAHFGGEILAPKSSLEGGTDLLTTNFLTLSVKFAQLRFDSFSSQLPTIPEHCQDVGALATFPLPK